MENLVRSHQESLNAAIFYAGKIERMGLKHMPMGGFIHKSTSTEADNELWLEIICADE